MNLFPPVPPETRRLLDGVPALIDKTFPLPGRFRSALPGDVAELSRLLTSGRGERSLSYMGRPPLLSAYLRYFLPWNLYRLCRLLPSLDIPLVANDRVVDLGCGPLTLASALWLCRPDLRELPLEFRCVDQSGPALEAGRQFFSALVGEGGCGRWKIHTVKGGLDAAAHTAARQNAEAATAALVCAVNVCNETYGDIPHHDSAALRRSAGKIARLLDGYAADTASILVVEPGLPRCGEFISLLRAALMERGRFPLAPCTHSGECPAPGGNASSRAGKRRWCHFAFETADAPAALHKLSALAGIPKERAVLSFLLAGGAGASGAAKNSGVSGTASAAAGKDAAARAGGASGTASAAARKDAKAARAGGASGTTSAAARKNAKVAKSVAPQGAASSAPSKLSIRIISDAFPLPHGRWGRYGCSAQGLVLVAGENVKTAASGAMAEATSLSGERDQKSGALLTSIAPTPSAP